MTGGVGGPNSKINLVDTHTDDWSKKEINTSGGLRDTMHGVKTALTDQGRNAALRAKPDGQGGFQLFVKKQTETHDDRKINPFTAHEHYQRFDNVLAVLEGKIEKEFGDNAGAAKEAIFAPLMKDTDHTANEILDAMPEHNWHLGDFGDKNKHVRLNEHTINILQDRIDKFVAETGVNIAPSEAEMKAFANETYGERAPEAMADFSEYATNAKENPDDVEAQQAYANSKVRVAENMAMRTALKAATAPLSALDPRSAATVANNAFQHSDVFEMGMSQSTIDRAVDYLDEVNRQTDGPKIDTTVLKGLADALAGTDGVDLNDPNFLERIANQKAQKAQVAGMQAALTEIFENIGISSPDSQVSAALRCSGAMNDGLTLRTIDRAIDYVQDYAGALGKDPSPDDLAPMRELRDAANLRMNLDQNLPDLQKATNDLRFAADTGLPASMGQGSELADVTAGTDAVSNQLKSLAGTGHILEDNAKKSVLEAVVGQANKVFKAASALVGKGKDDVQGAFMRLGQILHDIARTLMPEAQRNNPEELARLFEGTSRDVSTQLYNGALDPSKTETEDLGKNLDAAKGLYSNLSADAQLDSLSDPTQEYQAALSVVVEAMESYDKEATPENALALQSALGKAIELNTLAFDTKTDFAVALADNGDMESERNTAISNTNQISSERALLQQLYVAATFACFDVPSSSAS